MSFSSARSVSAPPFSSPACVGSTRRDRRAMGFTIIEVMVALAITMIMMGALAQAFKYLGTRMQAGRAEVELSSKVRSTSVRLRDELRRTTARINALPQTNTKEGNGYFTYYEGPHSDLTTSLYGAQMQDTDRQAFVYMASRVGDYDDYLAFTVQAPAGSWFTGKVPRFVADPTNRAGLPVYDPFEPVEITSQYAEVVYWVSPEWERDRAAQVTYPGTDHRNIFVKQTAAAGNYDLFVPQIRDDNSDALPDRLMLRRRVLLIRPDLNLPEGFIPIPQLSFSDARDDFWFWNQYTSGSGATPLPYMAANWSTNPTAFFQSNWLVGMQLVYQLCDLSVSRRFAPAGGPLAGLPLTPAATLTPPGNNPPREFGIHANTLADLAAPHNRFAHVRMPGELFGAAANTQTTMPLLALTGSEKFLSLSPSPALHLPYPKPIMPGVTATAPPIMNGFVIPNFELSSFAANLLGDTRWDRTGEDVIAIDVLGFDVQAFDPTAPVIMSNGNDGAPGTINNDDGGLGGTVDDILEQGATGTDDLLITPSDPAYFSVLVHGALTPGAAYPATPAFINDGYDATTVSIPARAQFATIADQGAYVDLNYVFQSGGTLQDLWFQMLNPSGSMNGPAYITMANRRLVSDFSGYASSVPASANEATTTSVNLRRSGRAVFTGSAASPTLALLQPAFDTYSNCYESDGMYQVSGIAGSPAGTWWMLGTSTQADRAVNGLDDPSTAPGADDISERETLPPYGSALRAIQVRIRLEDTGTRQFKQMNIIHDFPE